MKLLPVIKAVATTFAADELTAATPAVEKAYEELPADIKSGDPMNAFLATAKEAGASILASQGSVSWTGLFGSVASLILTKSA